MLKLAEFLEKRRVKGGEPFTHTSMVQPRGNYYIGEKHEDIFWTLYCNNLAKGEQGDTMGLTEIPNKCSPLRIDFDFKFPIETGLTRKYIKDHVETIIHIYQNIIMGIADPSDFEESERILDCVFLEKEKPRREQDYIKDGFHLHFPRFVCDAHVQNQYIRDMMLEKLENDPDLENFRKDVVDLTFDPKKSENQTTKQKLVQIVDSIGTKTWLLYGSKKDKDAKEYFKLSNCYDGELNDIDLETVFQSELEDLRAKGKKLNAKYYLPRLLSIKNYKKEIKLNDEIQEKLIKEIKHHSERKRKAVKQTKNLEDILADLKTIDDGKLMDMLSDDRAENRDSWMDVGWTLFNIGQGHDKALDMWIDFSKRSEKFKDGECERLWDTMELKGKTMGSLLRMIKEDSPDKYATWKDDQITTHLYKAVSTDRPTENLVAKVVHKLYEYRFVCASSKNDIWYEFYGHRYHLVDDAISIVKLLTTEVCDLFLKFEKDLWNKIRYTNEDDEKEKERNKKYAKRANKIVESLNLHSFCTKVVKMCKLWFHDANFFKKMDENRDLVGFENGVYDLKTGIFRNGSPDDYITFSTGRNYYAYGDDDEEMLNLLDYLRKVYVNPRILEYFLDFVCSCLQGGNRNKIFAVFTGPGDAGKTMIVKLLTLVFGDYSLNFPRETFVMGRGSSAGGARPDLARVRGKRIAFVKEIASNEKLHIGMVKEMTGNDSFFARNIYEKGMDINPMFTLILMCNDPPEIPAHDEPTWNRVKVIPHESCFPKPDDPKKKVPEDVEEQIKQKIFPQDPHFEEKLEYFAGPLTSLLFKKFKDYIVRKGLKEPEEIRKSSYRYKVRNNVFIQFFESRIEKDEESSLRLKDTFDEFKKWYAENYPSYSLNKDRIGKIKFKEEMIKQIGDMDEKGVKWVGYRFKTMSIDKPLGQEEDTNVKKEGDVLTFDIE